MKSIDEFPEETRNVIEKLIKKGCISEKEEIMNISNEMAYILLILDRADVFNWFPTLGIV